VGITKCQETIRRRNERVIIRGRRRSGEETTIGALIPI